MVFRTHGGCPAGVGRAWAIADCFHPRSLRSSPGCEPHRRTWSRGAWRKGSPRLRVCGGLQAHPSARARLETPSAPQSSHSRKLRAQSAPSPAERRRPGPGERISMPHALIGSAGLDPGRQGLRLASAKHSPCRVRKSWPESMPTAARRLGRRGTPGSGDGARVRVLPVRAPQRGPSGRRPKETGGGPAPAPPSAFPRPTNPCLSPPLLGQAAARPGGAPRPEIARSLRLPSQPPPAGRAPCH